MLRGLAHFCHGARLGELQVLIRRRESSSKTLWHLLVPKGGLKKSERGILNGQIVLKQGG